MNLDTILDSVRFSGRHLAIFCRFYDQRFTRLKMFGYSGKQRALSEISKMFTGRAKKSKKSLNDWNNPDRLIRRPNKFPLAEPPLLMDPGPLPGRVIIAWGDGQFPTVAGNPAAPSTSIYRKLKSVSRMLGTFPPGILFLLTIRSSIIWPTKIDCGES